MVQELVFGVGNGGARADRALKNGAEIVVRQLCLMFLQMQG